MKSINCPVDAELADMEKSAMTSCKDASTLSRKDSRRRLLRKILANSSVTGLSRAASVSHTGLKVFWTVLFVGGLIGFSVNFNSILKRHRQEPVLTQINHEFAKFTWPHMTFCNPSNPIPFWRQPRLKQVWSAFMSNASVLQRALREQGIHMSREEIVMSSVSPKEFFEQGVKGFVYRVLVYFRVSKKIAESSGNYDSLESVKNFEFAFDDRLTSSKFPLPCYTLKPEHLFDQDVEKKMAELNSIKMYLLLDFQSYLFFNYGFQNRKLYLYLTVPNTTLTSSDPFFIGPGTTSHFQITENRLKRIKNCHNHNLQVEVYNTQFNTSRPYRGVYNDCRYNISQRLYFERCGCYTPSLPISKVTHSLPRLCFNMSIFNTSEIISNIQCLKNVNKEYSVGNKFEEILDLECDEYFKSMCNQTSYTIVRRTNIWPTKVNADRRSKLKKHARYLPNAEALLKMNPNHSITEDFTLQNLAIVDFHRSMDRSVLTFEEWEYPMSEFLSDVGGILGLWLGLSVIGVFELIELVIMFVMSLFISDMKN